jgi:hypothetical protein
MSYALRLLFAFTLLAFAPARAAGPLHVIDAYVRATPAGQSQSAAYMTLRNPGAQRIALTLAASPAAQAVELHTVVDAGGVKKMRPVASIEVPAGGETRLQPGGLHIMLIGLKEPLHEGAHVPLTLSFDNGQRQVVQAPVRAIEATLPKMHHGH